MGMTADAVATALEEARFEARQDLRLEDLADDCGRAVLAEWDRIDQLLAAADPGTVYAPDTGDVIQAELAAEREAEPPGSPPAPMSSRRCARWARWSRPSPARATKPGEFHHPAQSAVVNRDGKTCCRIPRRSAIPGP
jgi:hypothetical protein